MSCVHAWLRSSWSVHNAPLLLLMVIVRVQQDTFIVGAGENVFDCESIIVPVAERNVCRQTGPPRWGYHSPINQRTSRSERLSKNVVEASENVMTGQETRDTEFLNNNDLASWVRWN